MRVYQKEQLEQVLCNRCGRQIEVQNQIIKEGLFSVDYRWGYFSNKDGKQHSFELCEECYDEILKSFKIPVDEKENTELI